MIFSFLGRLFGGRPSGPPPLLTIEVVLDRSGLLRAGLERMGFGGSELRVLDAGGNPAGGPWPVRGNVPEGDYLVSDFVRPDQYPGGAAAIGRCGALRLRGEEDRMVLLHGNGGGHPADGAIQVDDAAMAAILNLIPEHPSRLERPVAVHVTARQDDGRESDWEREERWRRERERDRDRDRDRSTGGAPPAPPAETRDDSFNNAQWWTPAVIAGGTAAAIAATRDAEAASGLAKAEVTMLPDGDAKPPALDGDSRSGDAPPPAADWSPSGGGYDR